MLEVGVSEIHAYPLRPRGFVEPLFPTPESRREVAEHLLRAPWLSRASELKGASGGTARSVEEPVEVRRSRGRAELVRIRTKGRYSRRKQRIIGVLDRWREVKEWWDEANRVDRLLFRVLLSGDAVADLARERSGGWFLVGVVD